MIADDFALTNPLASYVIDWGDGTKTVLTQPTGNSDSTSVGTNYLGDISPNGDYAVNINGQVSYGDGNMDTEGPPSGATHYPNGQVMFHPAFQVYADHALRRADRMP